MLMEENGVHLTCHPLAQSRDADIPGNMAGAIGLGDPQCSQSSRDHAACMIADQQNGDCPCGLIRTTGPKSSGPSRAWTIYVTIRFAFHVPAEHQPYDAV